MSDQSPADDEAINRNLATVNSIRTRSAWRQGVELPSYLNSPNIMPDLNSVPASPHALAHSRRQSSQQSLPPSSTISPGPDTSLNILPSNQDAVNHPSTSSPPDHSTQPVPTQPLQAQSPPPDAAVGAGPGPLRHPRPMTATELHMELEKEQEAVVS